MSSYFAAAAAGYGAANHYAAAAAFGAAAAGFSPSAAGGVPAAANSSFIASQQVRVGRKTESTLRRYIRLSKPRFGFTAKSVSDT